MQSTRGLDPPDFQSPHDNASGVNQYADVTLPAGGNNFTSLTFVHSYDTFQIPNDVVYGEPATTDDNENQEDTFFSLQLRRALGDNAGITFGPALKVSHISDFGDPVNDWIYGEALNVEPPPFGNGGGATDCADALKTPENFSPTTCAYTLTDSRTATDYILQGDYSARAGRHEIRAGVSYDLARIDKDYQFALQPNNFLAPILTPQTPNAPATVVNDAPNVGNTYQSYVQDDLAHDGCLGGRLRAALRLLYDSLDAVRAGLRRLQSALQTYAQLRKASQSLRLRRPVLRTVLIRERLAGRRAAAQSAAPANASAVRPQARARHAARVRRPRSAGPRRTRLSRLAEERQRPDRRHPSRRDAAAPRYQLRAGAALARSPQLRQPLSRNGRAYLSLAHTVSLNKGCETQLLAPCFGSPSDFTPADHNQAYTVTGGDLLNDSRGGWLSADGEYGSGLSSGFCPAVTPGYCSLTPHTIFNVAKGIALRPSTVLTLGIQNILNDRYYVTLINAQGNHFAPARSFSIGVQTGHP